MTLTTAQVVTLMAVSSAAQAGMQVMSARGQASGAKMQAELARRQAERERQIGAMQAQQQRERSKRTEGTQRALLAARGGDTGTGSALLVQEELAEEGEFNARLAEITLRHEPANSKQKTSYNKHAPDKYALPA